VTGSRSVDRFLAMTSKQTISEAKQGRKMNTLYTPVTELPASFPRSLAEAEALSTRDLLRVESYASRYPYDANDVRFVAIELSGYFANAILAERENGGPL